MAVFNVMFPILPGKEDAARAWIEEFSGPRRAGFDELQRRSEIERETLTLLKTPMGSFLLVWVSTPIEECERRDVKGLYAKARAGEITGFTGVDDPYEAPADAELEIDTTDVPVDDAVTQVLALLT